MKQYIKPEARVFSINPESILTGSELPINGGDSIYDDEYFSPSPDHEESWW